MHLPIAIQPALPAEPPPIQLEAFSRVTFNDGGKVALSRQGNQTPFLPATSSGRSSLSLCARMFQYRGERLKHLFWCSIAPHPTRPAAMNDEATTLVWRIQGPGMKLAALGSDVVWT